MKLSIISVVQKNSTLPTITHEGLLGGTTLHRYTCIFNQKKKNNKQTFNNFLQDVMNEAYSSLLPKTSTASAPTQVFCTRTNVSVCDVTVNNDDFTVTLYNPVARSVDVWAHVPVAGPFHNVFDSDMNQLNCSVMRRQDKITAQQRDTFTLTSFDLFPASSSEQG